MTTIQSESRTINRPAMQPAWISNHSALAVWFLAGADAGRAEDAIEQYEQALHLIPQDSAAYLNLMKTYAALHRSAEAMATAQRTLELARSQHDNAPASQVEAWIADYREQQTNP